MHMHIVKELQTVELSGTALGPNLQNILRQSYDNAKVTIDLQQTSNLQNISKRMEQFS